MLNLFFLRTRSNTSRVMAFAAAVRAMPRPRPLATLATAPMLELLPASSSNSAAAAEEEEEVVMLAAAEEAMLVVELAAMHQVVVQEVVHQVVAQVVAPLAVEWAAACRAAAWVVVEWEAKVVDSANSLKDLEEEEEKFPAWVAAADKLLVTATFPRRRVSSLSPFIFASPIPLVVCLFRKASSHLA
ncbi:hypothetical protein BC567DRAFT_223378 [Phyllosticta citribraziliensis]